MQNHIISEFTNQWRKTTKAFWSIKPNKKAVIFIHGFKGGFDTWKGFPENLLFDKHIDGYDIFFIEYPSTKQITYNSTAFSKELDKLFSSPQLLFRDSKEPIRRPENFTYSKVLLVTHSLGAPMTRKSLAISADKPWVSKIKILHFAPALMGEIANDSIMGLVNNLPFAAAKLIASYLQLKWPALGDLRSGSPFLSQLRNDVSGLISSRGAQPYLVPDVVVGADDELIVSLVSFCSDPTHKFYYKNTDHFSICKPKPDFLDSYNEVIKQLPN